MADSPVLSGLTIGSLTLSPAFDPTTTGYTLATSNNTNKVTATCDDTSAVVSISLSNSGGGTDIENGTAAAWASGENVLTIIVAKGEAKTEYTVTVTKS